ncbi:DHHA1 domain-containing protein [Neobacillus pocheonensis]|uniref:alanyl-tRNA editing protein n=1 Tax=Neobacillus pocheonensis TaxID=363869 RepID=UPI003D2C7759
MENKLYYQDPYIQSFSAQVLKQEKDEAGQWYVVLNQTAYYPTGGGQPHDIGMIDQIKVINVEEIAGEIRHYLEEPLLIIDKAVLGVIDWKRRFDHMQQHSGQHILSAAFEQLFHYQTVGFHLGNDIVTIDLETENITEQEVKKAEEFANQIILENRPIEVKWVTEEELSQYPLRKETKVKEDIRLVIIPDFDYNGCGGTHPKSTSEVSAIKILDWERQRKNIRLQFVCGHRVLQQLDEKQRVILQLTQLLNAPEVDMVKAVNRLLESGKSQEKLLEQTKETLLQYEAKELIHKNNTDQLVTEIFHQRSIQELQKIARLITAENDNALVMFISKNEDKLQLVGARGGKRDENMKNIIGKALPHINGKGGGNAAFAQGGGEALIPADELLQLLLE